MSGQVSLAKIFQDVNQVDQIASQLKAGTITEKKASAEMNPILANLGTDMSALKGKVPDGLLAKVHADIATLAKNPGNLTAFNADTKAVINAYVLHEQSVMSIYSKSHEITMIIDQLKSGKITEQQAKEELKGIIPNFRELVQAFGDNPQANVVLSDLTKLANNPLGASTLPEDINTMVSGGETAT